MSLQTCIAEAKEWAKKNSELKLKPAEIEDLGRLLDAAHEAGSSQAEKMQLMQDAVLKRIEQTQLANRGEKYLNAIKNAQNADNISKNVELWNKDKETTKPMDWVNALEAHITGESPRKGFGVHMDPLANSRANSTKFLGYLENSLSKPELKVFKALAPGDDLGLNIMKELQALRDKTQLGKTGSEMALSIAKKFREASDAVFKEAQAVNPYLRENTLYLFHRSWNRELVAKVTEDQFVKDMMANYGKNIIGDEAKQREVFSKAYKDIRSGLPPEGQDFAPRFWEPQGTGGSQALQSAGHRVFTANDVESEWRMNAKYGNSLYNSFVKQAERQADYVATVNKWGTQAADNFKKLFDMTYKAANSPEAKDLLMKNKQRLQDKFDATQASRYNEAWRTSAKLAQGLVAMENLSMLGTHPLRILNSGPAILAQLRDGYGMNIFERSTSVVQSFAHLMANFGDAGREQMRSWGVSCMSAQREMANQIARGNGVELGAAAKASRMMGSLTLADYTTNAFKFAMAENDTRALGKMASKSFTELPAKMQETLRGYNLHDGRWEVARRALKDGRITPDGLRDVPDEVIHEHIGTDKTTSNEAMRLRSEVAQSLGTYLNDRASMSVGESNAASRAKAYGTSDINTPEGIARTFFYQFKQASMVRQQLLARTWRAGGGNTANISGTIQYMLGMSFMGMVGQQLAEVGAGREPLDIKDPKILGHMLRSTGIAGFYGDMIADYLTAPDPDKMKRFVEGDFLGPSFGTAEKGAEAVFRTTHGVAQYAEGKDRHNQFASAQWLRLMHSLTPGQNIFWAKGALDYHLFKGVHEFLGDSGYVGLLRNQLAGHKDLFGNRQKPLGE